MDPKAKWREHQRRIKQPSNISIALAGSVTLEPLEPYVGAHLLQKGFKSPNIVIGAFNQIHQICFDYKSVFGNEDFDALVLLWRLEDIFPSALDQSLEKQTSTLFQEIEKLAKAIKNLRGAFNGTLIVSTPPYPFLPEFEVLNLGQGASGMVVYQEALHLWTEEMSKLKRVQLLDLHGLLLNTGLKNAYDVRKWYLYHQPYTEIFWQEIGTQIGRIISAEKISPKKCIVLDCDDTLWGGIVGEDGLQGIRLGDEFPGKAFCDFQRYLLWLKNNGIFLTIVSKNNPDDVFEVFDKHDAMVLSRKDIAAFEIGWESKVEGIKRIAKKLNIGLDSLVFIDDSAKEIGEVRDRLSEVTCLLTPEELAHLPGLLRKTDLFDTSEITDEDRKRTEMIVSEQSRLSLQEAMLEVDFRKSLKLEVHVFEMEKQHLARITQLINKTNQFNMTTIRRTQNEVEVLVKNKDFLVLGCEVKDRYGEYGLVGVAILKKKNKVCDIDTLLMSCRVLGRGAETAFIAKLAESAEIIGCEEIYGHYISTPKNKMVRDLYKKHNFRHDSESDAWIVKTDAAPKVPKHIQASLRLVR